MPRLVLRTAPLRSLTAGCHPDRRRRHTARQTGQGTIEFLVAAVPVLLLALGSIEFIHWYFVRQAVSLALMQAGRAAITQHADPAVLDAAFASALLPLHAGPTPAASQERLARAVHRREAASGLPAWQIRIVSPSVASFADFASTRPELDGGGRPVIDNDYLQEQHLSRVAQGWPQGRGPQSGQTTLQANTLLLRLTWLHEPLLPGMKQVVKQLAPADARYGSLAMAAAGFLPIHRQIALVMQSHAIEWETPAHGRVIRNTAAESPSSLHSPTDTHVPADRPQTPCTGLWCVEPLRNRAQQNDSTGQGSGVNPPGHGESHGGNAAGNAGQLFDSEQSVDDASRSTDDYRGPDTDAPSADCPGCCD